MIVMKISPFTPELGIMPKHLVDREIFQKIKGMCDYASQGKAKNNLLAGKRGSGKTVTLRVLSEIGRARGFLPVYVSCNETIATPDKLSATIYERSYEALLEHETYIRLRENIKRYVPTVPTIKLPGGIGIKLEKKELKINQHNIVRHLSSLLENRRTLFLFDEVQSIFSKGVARFIVNLFYSDLPEKFPYFITMLCGTPILKTDILEATPAYRAFSVWELPPFSPIKAKELLQNTVKGTKTSFDDDSCQKIYVDTAGLPYYLHYWGDYLWQKKEGGQITSKFYDAVKQEMFQKLSATVLERVLDSLERKRGVGIYRKIFEEIAKSTTSKKSTITHLVKKYGRSAPVYVQRLHRMGYLTQIKKGVYIPEDPLLAKYILKKRL